MQLVFGVHKMLYKLLTIKNSIWATALIESDLKNAFVKKAYFLVSLWSQRKTTMPG